MMNSSIDHITIIVSDLEVTRRFYIDVLGMQEVARPAFDFPGAWFANYAFQIHATLSNDQSGLAGPGNRDASVVSRGQHFAFRVEDFSAAINHLKKLDVKIAAGPKSRPDGVSQAYFFDPDGYLIEICG